VHRYDQGNLGDVLAGDEIDFTASTSDGFKLLTLRATLSASATVANRVAHFQFVSQSGDVIHEIVAHSAQVASAVTIYNLVGGNGANYEGSAVNDGVASLPLPDLWFPAGTLIKTKTTALDVGDKWGSVYWSALTGDEWAHLALLEEIASNIGH